MKLKFDYNCQTVQVPLLAYGAIDDELKILYECMVVEIVGMLAPLLSFMEFVTT
jgi:hypothetical protein